MITLEKDGLKLVLTRPGTYYQGTRFDRAGVFRSVEKEGRIYADEWFRAYDPLMHDAVCGPSEEFGVAEFENEDGGFSDSFDLAEADCAEWAEARGRFLKPGVGWLRRPDAGSLPDLGSHPEPEPYDRFRLYEVADEGVRSLEVLPDAVIFGQKLDVYNYLKTIRLTGPDSFEITHRFENLGTHALRFTHYNHNFFTLESASVGPAREIDFPFKPCGHWRSEYDNVRLTDGGIRFSGVVPSEGPSVFMGDLKAAGRMVEPRESMVEPRGSVEDGHFSAGRDKPRRREGQAGMAEPIDFTVRDRESGIGVHVSCPLPFTHMVFWSNDRVACVEPYLLLTVGARDSLEWTLNYRLL